jgi:hypothetical protein
LEPTNFKLVVSGVSGVVIVDAAAIQSSRLVHHTMPSPYDATIIPNNDEDGVQQQKEEMVRIIPFCLH